ncbi:MAG: Transport permease protein [Pseudomonadota bacterium]|nr:Transport permease protein [Pseudomonadota bacterium]
MIHRLPGALRLFPPFIGRELREQYAGSWLGVVWSLLQPLLFILLYWWVFAAVLRTRFPQDSALADTPFIVFLLSALLPWFAFQEGLNRATGAILNRRDVVRKVHFPVRVFPLAAAAAAYIVHGLGYILFLTAFALWQGGLSFTALSAIALLLALQFAVTAGLGLLLAAFTVYLRDIQQILGLALAVMFYTAPILYPLTVVPENFHRLIHLNPFTLFAEAYHSVVLLNVWPGSSVWLGLTLLALGALGAGAYVFQRLESGFADVL